MNTPINTLAPFHFVETGEANHYMVVSENRWIMSIQINGELTVEKQLEVMKKVTAANQLLEALINLHNKWQHEISAELAPKFYNEIEAAKAAIKKATE